jgi:hypothetical protein
VAHLVYASFRCPLCGGSTWGTYFDEPGRAAIRVIELANSEERRQLRDSLWAEHAHGACHGQTEGVACTFTWRRADDALYFRKA